MRFSGWFVSVAFVSLQQVAFAQADPPKDRLQLSGVDPQEAAPLLQRYRDDFAKNTRQVLSCNALSDEACTHTNIECETFIDWGEHGTGGPTLCRAPEAVIHAWKQEDERRRCANSAEGVWKVYQVSGGKLYGTCQCPLPATAAMLSNGPISFDPEVGQCLSSRQHCARQGGKFSPPTIAKDIAPEFTKELAAPLPDTASSCVHTSGRIIGAQYIYWHWVPTGKGRCERTVLSGFREPRPDYGRDDRTVFSTSLCKVPQ